MREKRLALVTIHQVEERPGLKGIHEPTRDWSCRMRGRRPVRWSDEDGNVFDGSDERWMQINGGCHFMNSKCISKRSFPNR